MEEHIKKNLINWLKEELTFFSNLHLQEVIWLNLPENPGLVSSFDEAYMGFFIDLQIETYLLPENWKELNLSESLRVNLVDFCEEYKVFYQKTESYLEISVNKFHKRIIAEPDWIEIANKAAFLKSILEYEISIQVR